MPEGNSSKKPKPPSKFDDGNFELHKKLGAGCFGEVYIGKDVKTDSKIAVKTEDCRGNALQLDQECSTLRFITNGETQPQGFAQVIWYGTEKGFNLLVMDLLGKSIEDMVQKMKGKFNPNTVVLLAQQVLHRIEYLHSRGMIHRDIKPENFMFGIDGKLHHVYLIDFGLSKLYWDKQHSQLRQKLSLTGTARYASINAHKGFEQSRRDDLEAIAHMLMYALRGTLPWSGLDAKTKEEKYRKIMQKKEQVPLPELCSGFPEVFERYLAYARGLEFVQRPDYDFVQKDFASAREKLGIKEDWEFQWMKDRPSNYVELLPRGKMKQPDDKEEVKKAPAKQSRSFFPCCGAKSAVED